MARGPRPYGWIQMDAFVSVAFETVLQLRKVVVQHGEIKPLGRWQAVALATRTLGGRLGHSMLANSVNLFSLG